eukprot:3104391-Pyramimonas_sp.AAC.1
MGATRGPGWRRCPRESFRSMPQNSVERARAQVKLCSSHVHIESTVLRYFLNGLSTDSLPSRRCDGRGGKYVSGTSTSNRPERILWRATRPWRCRGGGGESTTCFSRNFCRRSRSANPHALFACRPCANP